MILTSCPACSKPLYLPFTSDDIEKTEVMCQHCNYLYIVKRFLIERSIISLETDSVNSKIIKYRQLFNLDGVTPTGREVNIDFGIPGRYQSFSVADRDTIFWLYLKPVKRQVIKQELVQIVNYSSNSRYRFFSPPHRYFQAGILTSILILLGGFFLLWFLSNFQFTKLAKYSLGTASVVAGLVTFRHLLVRDKVTDKLALKRLTGEQNILKEIQQFRERIDQLHNILEKESNLLARLTSIQDKMRQTSSKIYSSRLQTFQKGIDVIDEKIRLSNTLIKGYLQVQSMLEIEYETSRLAETIPEDSSTSILTKLSELKALEEQFEEISINVAPEYLLAS